MSTSTTTGRPGFDAKERHDILGAFAEALRAGDRQAAAEIGERYRDRVPVLPLSRSPIDGSPVFHSLDPFDIDGLWWDYDNPRRPIEEVPDSWFAMTGAMRLGTAVPFTEFLVIPGPEMPFLVPRMLERDGVVAVVSRVAVGPHVGYPITYFAPPPVPRDLKRINDWGANAYTVLDPVRGRGWDSAIDWSPEWDFDLAPWIEGRKVAWIAPGDAALELRWEVDGCPYLGLRGSEEPARIQFGRVTYPPPPPEAARRFRPNS